MNGRVTCEISSEDELLLTELIFNGVFNALEPEVFAEKEYKLAAPLCVMREFARRTAKVSEESKVSIDENEYLSSFKVEVIDAVVHWCRGSSFTDILKESRPMAQDAKAIGTGELKEKFEKTSEMLERPNSIIFYS
ncbi:hypothetical protein AGABI1DRAFT_101993 [Agaricus bisporus var. burnettii JB137-S8]|uniref:ATP-dependent RNA helicase Ski2/MTR4 C-terminal domain-containing protein n=1 Tax=Agaricus bisporus var. burnettii (strain JB137-S8 / ATCC MYA-4627 / FGSC 10392) TaxID=597362 RepID=K5XQL2_AGABU|nr:uncharacterized protein AGABI1DRAFT_101993 [Agaricus bisporus var. burnettii JB137-S8]EKM77070.1 hypothetical protein AGABI1DRAFT_101993 [Agaricus bisporus var. burnettii JB137-S8]